MKPPNYPIESVDNALKLLLALVDQPPMTVSKAGELLEVAPSTAHRLFAMLQYRGFADQDPVTRHYRAGPMLRKLGLTSIADLELRRQARPILERLSADLGETANLVMLQGSDILFVDCVESASIVRVSSRMGLLLPAHCSSGGKALLAEMTLDELRELYPSSRLPKMTPQSITWRSQLESELTEIRARGYAANVEESEKGLVAVASTIRDRWGQALGAIAIAAPRARLGRADVDRVGQAVLLAAKEIGAGSVVP